MKLKMRNKVTPEFTMAAMTDFVFQLLIIFMLISTLATESNSHTMDINLPQSSINTGEPPSNVVVSVTPDLKYAVKGEETPKDQLVQKVKPFMSGANPPTIQLAIDENCPHKVFVELVDIFSVQNKWKIGVQTKELPK